MPVTVFGNGAVQTAYVSFTEFDLSLGSLTLIWPTSYVNVPYTLNGINYNVLAASMLVTTANPNINTITLPDATMASVGQNFIITNSGIANFNLLQNGSTMLASIAVGISYWVQLVDNSTSAGMWTVITFGAGTSTANAAALAGLGLVALPNLPNGTLNTNIPILSIAANTTITVANRAQLIIWTGGAGTITLPAINTIPAGFYVSINNQGSGIVQIATADLTNINSNSYTAVPPSMPLAVTLNQSLTLISDGVQWWSLGFGQNQFSTVTVYAVDVSGSTDIILTNAQSSSLIQEYSGTLTGNIKVFFPTFPNNWYISNQTTGPYTLSVQLVGPLGFAIEVPQVISPNANGTYYSNGISMYSVP